MPPRIPKNPSISRPPSLPTVAKGSIYENVGKYARGAVLYAFEQIGGADGLSEWAAENPDDFYTKLFPKIITREVEVTENRGVDELLNLLDGDYEVVVDDASSSTVTPPPVTPPPVTPPPVTSPLATEPPSVEDAFEALGTPLPRGFHD